MDHTLKGDETAELLNQVGIHKRDGKESFTNAQNALRDLVLAQTTSRVYYRINAISCITGGKRKNRNGRKSLEFLKMLNETAKLDMPAS